MKLLNQSLTYLSFSILAIVAIWGVLFYVNTLNEIKSSIDEGLENYKRLIIQNAQKDSTILTKTYFDESFFTIRKLEESRALAVKDQYLDTEILMQDADDEELEMEPVRMLVTAFGIDGQYYELKVANSMVEEDDLIKELLRDVIWLYVILIIAIILVNNFVLKKLWKPFYHVLDQLKNFRLGHSQHLAQTHTRTKEFLDLQKVVNTLLEHTINTFEQQKQFIGNASHELQTPLAIATHKLELVLENGKLDSNDARNLTETYQIIQRLVHLNRSLLLLTKIENHQFLDNQTISVNAMVRQAIDDMEDITAFKDISVHIQETTELSTQMDTALAHILISNLIRNAISHNVKHGKIEISITESDLKIYNTGNSEALDDTLIFDRFHKSGPTSNSTGLGLAIVKAITDFYAFRVTYSFQDGLHCFELSFN
ncbi:sensor histidine kinase [Flagellimonas sp.]|uniref:sensor histidine kinase n=1 Tax=Flagellimonas sp. TaxID=2058762 RepID=UPI003AB7D87C